MVTGPVPFKNVLDWSPDGKFLLYSALGVGTNMDLWFVPADGSGEPRPYQAGTFQEDDGRFSPDGRWVTIEADVRDADRAPDGRFLVIKSASEAREPSVTVALNALPQLDRRNP